MKKPMSRGVRQGIALVAVLAVAVAALAVVSLKKTRPYVSNAGATPGYAATVEESGVTEPPVETAPLPSRQDLPITQRVLTATDGNNAYRAVTGSCPAAQTIVERTSDGGTTWTQTDLGALAPVSAVHRILVGLDGYAAVIALNRDDCNSAVAMVTFDGGTGWQGSAEVLGQTWRVDPANPAVIWDPVGASLDAPCPVMRLASAGTETAGLVCADGRIFATSDSGATWYDSTEMTDVDALSGSSEGFLAASIGVANCSGVQVSALDTSLGERANWCVEGAVSSPGLTAISVGGDGSFWLWAGDQMFRSLDGGTTWQ